MRKGILVLLTTLITSLTHANNSLAATIEYQIRNIKTGSPIISVNESSGSEGGELIKTTSYQALSGGANQKEVIRFDEPSNTLKTYHYDDFATGEMWDVKVGKGEARVELRTNTGASVSAKVIPWQDGVIVGRQIPDFLLKNWTSLTQGGETLSFELYVPFRQEIIGFQAKVTASDARTSEYVITAEPRNWLLRKLAPSIVFTIRGPQNPATEPTILKFRGPCPVDFDGVKNQLIEILF